jgi:prepilin-type N-terminal cleavage/methylation domain-containing protein/prepilin-type processing-associated H-X9-DG protein
MLRRDNKGVTLIEMLTVIAIIGILAALVFPTLAKTREKARQTECLSNLKQIGMALELYVSENGGRWPNCGGEWGRDEYYHTIGTHYFPQFIEPYVKDRKIWECPSDIGGVEWKDGGITDVNRSVYDQCGSSYQFIPQKFVNFEKRVWRGPVIPVPYEPRYGMPSGGAQTQWFARLKAKAMKPEEFPLIADVLQWHHEKPKPGTPVTDNPAFANARRNVWFADGHVATLIETEFWRMRDSVQQYTR